MRRERKAVAGLLATSCIGMILSGCAADAETKGASQVPEPVVYEVEADGEATGVSKDSAPDEAVTSGAGGESLSQADATGKENAGGESPSQTDVSKPQDAAEATSLYEQFLSNGVSATVNSDCLLEDYGMTPIFEVGNSFTLAELGERVSAYYLNPEYSDKKSYDEVQYAYVECPDSADDKNLLVKFVGLNIYAPDDESYAVFVITQNNGQLYLSHKYECWARSETKAYANGLLSDYGSGGAGGHYAGISAVFSNGRNTAIYDAEILMGFWTSYANEAIYHEVFDENTTTNLTVSIYDIGDEKYYWYDMSDCDEDDKARCETYINRCKEEAGLRFVTQEEIQALIEARCQEIGIDYSLTEQKQDVGWQKL